MRCISVRFWRRDEFCFGEVSPGHVGSQYPAELIGYGDIFVGM